MSLLRVRALCVLVPILIFAVACGGAPPKEPPAAPVAKTEPPPPPPPPPPPSPPPAEAKAGSMIVVAPVLPGKMDAWKTFIAQMNGPRKEEYAASRKAAGMTQESVFVQKTPHGDFAVVYIEAADPKAAFESFQKGATPADKDFIALLKDVHGIDLTQPMPPVVLGASYDGDGKRGGAGNAFFIPVLKGKEADAEKWMTDMEGPKAADFDRTRALTGVTFERVFKASSPNGMLIAVYIEAADPAAALKNMVTSTDPFLVQFFKDAQTLTGIDFSKGSPPVNEKLADYRAN